MINNSHSAKQINLPKLKRYFDIGLSLVLLIILTPLFLIILLAILIEQLIKGHWPSLFYMEKRVSQGQLFNFIKFNIFNPGRIAAMKENGEFIHTKKLEQDKNSTLLMGRMIQHLYLDELPQLFNILKGDLSFVGPRPVNIEVYQRGLKRNDFTKTIIKAGLTGNYQAHKGEPGANQYRLDTKYIEYLKTHKPGQVLLIDVKIIFRTLVIIFRAQGY